MLPWNEKNAVGMIRMACNLDPRYFIIISTQCEMSTHHIYSCTNITILYVYVEANTNFVALSFFIFKINPLS